MGKKQIVIETDDVKKELDVKYDDGDEFKTEALIILVDHDPSMSFITHGNAQKIARLIFGAYRIAMEKASRGSIEDAKFVEMLEKVCEDIATVASIRKNKIDPEELLDELDAIGWEDDPPDGNKKPH